MTEETKEKSTTRKIEEELEILVQISSEMQKQLDKGECKLLGFKEAADYLGCSHSFLYKLTSANLINPCYKPQVTALLHVCTNSQDWVSKGRKKGSSIYHPLSSHLFPSIIPLLFEEQNRRIF